LITGTATTSLEMIVARPIFIFPCICEYSTDWYVDEEREEIRVGEGVKAPWKRNEKKKREHGQFKREKTY